ncbi:hypothetical protein [Flavobacterium cerinum]|uniref:DUF3990 domain-containing protein n=1 Tax=Flavobacterium cerinum TaxID=2502784 RepID=A0ABY5IUX7_9FLAO|nr:hypothetical protein [Flavobacterium cerinum]UUC45139.1 hypothetical protein NOX80_16130 [Flavobacterium cerinum]
METTFEINDQNLLHFLAATKTNNSCGGHTDFLEWNNETEELKTNLTKIGQIAIQPNEKQWDSQYWGQEAKIQLDRYPYYGCEIFQCQKCNTFFFYYLESGGHGAQKRYRVIRKELIDIESITPSYPIIIDYKNLDYTIFKNPDLTYAVSISKNIGIGLDVYYQLSKEEQEGYLRDGINSLSNRIKDMDLNYSNYKVTSWR